MKPVFKIKINRGDLTQAMHARVLEIKVEDSAGYDNDNLVVKIDGRAPFPTFPKAGAIAQVYFGYEKMENVQTKLGLTLLGTYELSDLDWDGPPWGLTLNFNAMSMFHKPKTARNATHEDTNLKELVETLAEGMGYQPDVHPSFADIKLDCEHQKNKTDMEFINELAQRYGAFPKVLNQQLRFHPKDGANFESEFLFLDQIVPGSLNYTYQVRGVYDAVQAATYSYDTGDLQRMEVTSNPEFTEGDKVTMELTRLYDTAEKALAAAGAKRDFLIAGTQGLSFKVGGNPKWQSHRKLELHDGGADGTTVRSPWHPGIPKEWIIVSSTHVWKKGSGGDDGYSTDVKCEVLKAQVPASKPGEKEDQQTTDDNAPNDLPVVME